MSGWCIILKSPLSSFRFSLSGIQSSNTHTGQCSQWSFLSTNESQKTRQTGWFDFQDVSVPFIQRTYRSGKNRYLLKFCEKAAFTSSSDRAKLMLGWWFVSLAQEKLTHYAIKCYLSTLHVASSDIRRPFQQAQQKLQCTLKRIKSTQAINPNWNN